MSASRTVLLCVMVVSLVLVWLRGNQSNSPQVATPPSVSDVTEVPLSHRQSSQKKREGSITKDTADFAALATKCTDKTLRHRYQELYARAFHGVRNKRTPMKLLEVGLGCIYDRCAAGGTKAFMSFLPNAKYHSLEYDVNTCKKKYKASGVGKRLAKYIDDHLCPGSSIDPEVIRNCSQRFGPFDIVIDDASHAHMHVTSAFRQWFPSSNLNPGGVYIVEDLQTVTLRGYDGTSEEPKNRSRSYHPAAYGATFMNYAQNIFFCKLAGLFCFTPTRGLRRHSVGVFVPLVMELVMGHESAFLRKRSPFATEPEPFATQDVIVALSPAEHAVYATNITVLVLKVNGSVLSPSTQSFIESKFPHGIVDAETRGGNGAVDFNDCFHRINVTSCLTDGLAQLLSTKVVIDMLWIETSASEDDATWNEQSHLVNFIISLLESTVLKPHGIVAINGYQSRQERNAAESASTQKCPALEPSSHGGIKEPLLRLLLDLSSSIMCCSARYIRGEHARLPFQPQYTRLAFTRRFVGDISIDDRGTVYIRKIHPQVLMP